MLLSVIGTAAVDEKTVAFLRPVAMLLIQRFQQLQGRFPVKILLSSGTASIPESSRKPQAATAAAVSSYHSGSAGWQKSTGISPSSGIFAAK